ncbi:MAG: hypothetical protein MHPSP_004934, partial [Paramarteilia canceri]
DFKNVPEDLYIEIAIKIINYKSQNIQVDKELISNELEIINESSFGREELNVSLEEDGLVKI